MEILKALSGPYTHIVVRFIPTGGVPPVNLAAYLQLPIVAAIGASWMVDRQLVNAGNSTEITRLTREAVEAAAR